MKDLIKNMGILAIAALCLVAFFALAGEPDVCYAERPCGEETISCMVKGSYCSADVTDDGVVCEGFDDNGDWVAVVKTCK